MPAQDPEILTISRCRNLLRKHDTRTRQRIVSWLMAWSHEQDEAAALPQKPDPRQPDLFNG